MPVFIILKAGIFRPGETGKCFKMKIETFRENSSDNLLSVAIEFLLKFKLNIAQTVPEN